MTANDGEDQPSASGRKVAKIPKILLLTPSNLGRLPLSGSLVTRGLTAPGVQPMISCSRLAVPQAAHILATLVQLFFGQDVIALQIGIQ